MVHPETPQNIQTSAIQFRAQFKTVLMATISDQQTADASYAPCILDDQSRTCIFISLLAQHTQNLINQPQASLLWIEDEQQATNIFARKRLTLDCSAMSVARDSAEWETLLNQFEQCHGETIVLLKTLQDFQLFRFEAHQGLYVRGFGEAYPVSGDSLDVSI
ncbi:MAG: pyridoxamine 5'-phosphate oxidase family protein [Methylococcales bacterium]